MITWKERSGVASLLPGQSRSRARNRRGGKLSLLCKESVKAFRQSIPYGTPQDIFTSGGPHVSHTSKNRPKRPAGGHILVLVRGAVAVGVKGERHPNGAVEMCKRWGKYRGTHVGIFQWKNVNPEEDHGCSKRWRWIMNPQKNDPTGAKVDYKLFSNRNWKTHWERRRPSGTCKD